MLNLTPHDITIATDSGSVTLPPSGTIARLVMEEDEVDDIGINNIPVPVIARRTGQIVGLPPVGTPCLVSSMVLDKIPGREGVFAPDTGSTAIRNEKGQVVAVTRLVAA